MGDAFPISGNIDPSSFPFLLVSLHQQGATGSLKVDGPNYQKALYFRGGRVLFGSSNDPRDQLGSILVESGRLTPEQLEDVNAKVGPGSPLAKVLAESGFVSQRELSEAARTKVELILADVLAYESGGFEFEDGVLPKGAVDLKLHPERLFLAATRRVTERGFVLRHLGGLDRVLRPAGDDGLREDLRPDCGGLLEVLDGSRTLKDATALTRLDEFEAAKLACGLLFLGLAAPASGTAKESPETFMALDDEGGFELPGPVELGTAPVASPLAPEPPPAEEQPLFLVPPAGPSAAPDFSLPPVEPPQAPAPPPPATPAPTAPQLELPIEPPTLIVAPAPSAPRPVTPPPPAPAPPPRPASPPAAPQRAGAGPDGKLPLVPPPPRKPARAAAAAELPLRPAPPSKDDLAAVDALLHSRSVEPPLSASTRPTPPPARSPAWEPRFGQAAKPARQRTGLSPLLIGTIAVLLAVAGVAAWYLWLRQPAATRPGARPTTTAPTVAPATPSPAPATPAPAATPEATASVASAPPAPASAAPSATPAATPLPTAPPTARPSAPPPTAPPAGGSLADARAALRSGAVARAGQLFAAALRSSPHGSQTVQLLVACSDETVGKAQAAVASDQLFVIPVTFTGRACQRLCWGVYDSPARAQAALASVPAYFREGGAKPKAIALAEILP